VLDQINTVLFVFNERAMARPRTAKNGNLENNKKEQNMKEYITSGIVAIRSVASVVATSKLY